MSVSETAPLAAPSEPIDWSRLDRLPNQEDFIKNVEPARAGHEVAQLQDTVLYGEWACASLAACR